MRLIVDGAILLKKRVKLDVKKHNQHVEESEDSEGYKDNTFSPLINTPILSVIYTKETIMQSPNCWTTSYTALNYQNKKNTYSYGIIIIC